MRPTLILGIVWGMSEDVPDLLISNYGPVTVQGLRPDCMNPLQERSFVNLLSFALTGNAVHTFQESIGYLGRACASAVGSVRSRLSRWAGR